MEHLKQNRFVSIEQDQRMVGTWHGAIGSDDPGFGYRYFHKESDAELWMKGRVRALQGRGYQPGYHNLKFIRAICERPGDDGVREVYGDWLTERDDPRGRLISLHVSLARDTTNVELQVLTQKCLEEHQVQFRSWSREKPTEVQWHLGFVQSASFQGNDLPSLGRLLRHSSGRFIESLCIESQYARASDIQRTRQTLQSILNRRQDCSETLQEVVMLADAYVEPHESRIGPKESVLFVVRGPL